MAKEREMFTEKYSPASFERFVGNSDIVRKVKDWADLWNSGKKQRPLFFYGPPGNGKTCLALLTAKEMGWDIFELNASDFRSKDVIEKIVGAASQSSSFSGTKRLILLDEVDGLQRKDTGGAGAILKILKESNNPVILTANDIYADQKLAPLRANSELMHFKKINYLSIASHLKDICKKEGVVFEDEAVKEMARNCSGDMRSALLDLQTLSSSSISMGSLSALGARERNENIFATIQKIFRAKTFREAREARFKSEVDSNFLERWIEENIPREFKGRDVGLAFDVFSRGDVFNGRIMKRQYYGFKRYSSELMTSGTALIRENDYHGWVQYQFPQIVRKLGSTKNARILKKEICKKVGKQIHSSTKQVAQNEFYLLKEIFKDKELCVPVAAQFDFDLSEIAFLMGSKPETKKVQNVLEQAQMERVQKIIEMRKQREKQSALMQKPEEKTTITLADASKPAKEPEKQKPKELPDDQRQTTLC